MGSFLHYFCFLASHFSREVKLCGAPKMWGSGALPSRNLALTASNILEKLFANTLRTNVMKSLLSIAPELQVHKSQEVNLHTKRFEQYFAEICRAEGSNKFVC